MRYLILHADDFGLTPGITNGILEAHTRGLLTSTSLIVGAPDATRAARLCRDHARLGVGLHLAITQVRPMLSPRRIPSLLGPDGRFLSEPALVLERLDAGQLDLEQLRAEWEAQLLAALELGLTLTHVDGHHHLHLHPQLLPVVLELMQTHGISAIRLPRPETPATDPERPLSARARALREFLTRLPLEDARQAIQTAGPLTTDHFIGLEQAGRFTTEALVQALLQLQDGTTELMLHPGHPDETSGQLHSWDYDWEAELQALQAPLLANTIREAKIELIHFGHLPTLRQDV